jgi:hypothetical protein
MRGQHDGARRSSRVSLTRRRLWILNPTEGNSARKTHGPSETGQNTTQHQHGPKSTVECSSFLGRMQTCNVILPVD